MYINHIIKLGMGNRIQTEFYKNPEIALKQHFPMWDCIFTVFNRNDFYARHI